MVPKRLQAVLWSVKTENLDPQKNRQYIIHQILAYGSWKDLKWLFETYDLKTVRQVFVDFPAKDYRPWTFNFVKNYVLGLEHLNLDQSRYDPHTPRIIG